MMEKVDWKIFLWNCSPPRNFQTLTLIVHPAGEEDDEEYDDDEIEGGTKRAAEDDDDDDEVRRRPLDLSVRLSLPSR